MRNLVEAVGEGDDVGCTGVLVLADPTTIAQLLVGGGWMDGWMNG